MPAMSQVLTHVAIKQHRCSWCGEAINPGETYSRYRYWDRDEAGTVKMHPECDADMQEEARISGGWIEWSPGCADRPTIRQNQLNQGE